MRIEFDAAKNEANRAKHGIEFASVHAFEFETAATTLVTRKGETRNVAVGYLAGRLYVLIYKRVAGSVRVISLRKANKREQRKYRDEET